MTTLIGIQLTKLVWFLMQEWKAEIVLDEKTLHGEGPIWWIEQGSLLWVDIEGNRVGIFKQSSNKNRWIDVGRNVGCLAPTESGDLIIACSDGFHRLDINDEILIHIVDPEHFKP